jgi:hypothetical protein
MNPRNVNKVPLIDFRRSWTSSEMIFQFVLRPIGWTLFVSGRTLQSLEECANVVKGGHLRSRESDREGGSLFSSRSLIRSVSAFGGLRVGCIQNELLRISEMEKMDVL